MAAEEPTAVARQLEEAFNRHDAGFYDTHPGLTPAKAFYEQLWAAFPDMRATPETTIADGGWIAQRLVVSGTMRGDFMGMPATGKHATYEVITMFRVEDGTIVKYYAQADVMGMMQQLGLGPAGGPPPR
jgi:predicted ester cyclase